MSVDTEAVGVVGLALFGGSPTFAEPLHVGRPNIGDREALFSRLGDMLDRRWLTNNGPYVQEFERRIACVAGVHHCIAICNATVALEILIRAVGLKGEVLVPSFTFVATAHALQWQEITPVFCDVNPVTHTIDPGAAESLITPKTTGILGVHTWGRACDTDGLTALSRRHGLRLIFDAAHAFGCSHQGRMIGSFGDAEVFSFHATKFLNSFDGGAIVTNDDTLATKIRYMRNFGFRDYDDVAYLGTNGKMTEIAAAMGLTSLESMESFVDTNRRNYAAYHEGLTSLPGVQLMQYDPKERYNYQYIVLEIDAEQAGISRNQLLKLLWAENVLARRYFYPGCHRMEPYRSYFPHAGLLLPETERLAQRVLVLPTGTAVGVSEIAAICGIIRFAAEHSEEITQRLPGN